MADWDDDDPQTIQDVSSRWDKVVILKHMFTLQELEVSHPHALGTSRLITSRRILVPYWRSRRISAKNVRSSGKSPM